MRYVRSVAISILLMAAYIGTIRAEDMPCNRPPFLGTSIAPNILILLDNSGSMNSWAYRGVTFHENTHYYGYFRNDKNYRYSHGVFYPSNCRPNSHLSNGCFPGNLLNWATMSRMDIAKKVLVGGKARSRQGNVHTLVAETWWGDGWRYFKYRGHKFFRYLGYGYPSRLYIIERVHWWWWSIRLWNAHVQVKVADNFARGIIQQIGDKDRDGHWDDNAPRFGLFTYNTNGYGGHIVSYIGNTTFSRFISNVENMPANGVTPLTSSYYEAVRYFRQERPRYYHWDYTTQHGGVRDPYYDRDWGRLVWCRKSFIILITDGEQCCDHGTGAAPGHSLPSTALWAHTNDMRGDIPGMQNMTLYTVFAFGSGSNYLKQAAKNGAFIDKNGNNRPDLRIEWDANRDGVPDAYFAAQNGFELEASIRKAIEDILQRVGAAAAVTIVSNTSKGEGIATQAFFLPKLTKGGRDFYWLGSVLGYWIDKYGNLREDTDHDLTLDDNDYIVRFTMQGNETKVLRLEDTDNDGIPDDTVGIVPLTQLGRGMNALFNAGERLFNKSHRNRNIYTHLPTRRWLHFTQGNRNDLAPYLGVNRSFADTLIRYIKGRDYYGYRPRNIDLNNHTWKLGDIINSTPMIVAEPEERYDKIYRDETYREFYEDKKDRRAVVYVGANDGMLHAFNIGVFDRKTKHINPQGHNIGDELWAYIPLNLLPHLKWLMKPDYCHVNYVDLPPKVSDLRIFSSSSLHTKGWGTVLFGGMGLGGYPITVNGRNFRSSYFALDVTNPDVPDFMWEFTDGHLGYTVNQPGIIKVDSTWYVILTSGPTDFDGNSNQHGYVYIINPKNGKLLRTFEIDKDKAYLGPPAVVDVNIDYSTDVVYIGCDYREGKKHKGKVYRLTLTDSNGRPTTDVSEWQLTTAISNLPGPVVAKLNASMDAEGNLWVFGGTGRYWSDADESTHPNNYLFGFKDDAWKTGSQSYTLNDLLDATDIAVLVDTTTGEADVHGVLGDTASFNSFETWVNENYQGWYIDIRDERSLNMPLVIGGAVFYTTFVPTKDPCGFGGQSYLYGLYYKTGTGYQNPILGLSSGEAQRKIEVGTGMASAPSVHLASSEANAQVVVQTSTGEIIQTSTPLPYKVKSGARIWRGLLF